MPSPSRKSKKDLTLPPGSLTLTLIGMNKSWDSRKHLMRKVYKSNQILNEGTCLSCCERFGGNTLQLIYPFIHLSGETKISKMNILPQNSSDEEPSKEWVDQGFYVELEHISSKTSFSFKELNYVIFIGVQSHQDSLSSRLENTWKSWSKIGLLTEELNNSKISVRSVTFFRQLAPRRLSMFNYCFFVTILLENPLDQVKCLSILQRLRGSIIPGYISLFQRNNETLGIAKNITENTDDHFEELLVSIEKDVNKNRYDVKNPKYRKRTVNTV